MYLENESLHSTIEREFSLYYGADCVLTQSGYAANTGLMHAICEKGMHVYIDKYTHMSFVDGLRNKCAIIHVSPHNDIADMESNIIKHGPGIIIVDALYSNNGSFAPITEILRLKRTYDCIVVVDESHSLGVYGRHGYLHMMGLEKEIDYITASLAKAFCTRAGLIIGGNATFIKENSWSYIFSSALTDNDIVRLRSMFEVIKNADDRRERLMAASHALREGLARITNVTLTDIPSPIICLDMDSDEKAAHLNRYLASRGIAASPFVWPARPRRLPTVRITLHSEITPSDVATIIDAIRSYKHASKL